MTFNVGEIVLFYALSQEVGFLATVFSIIQFFLAWFLFNLCFELRSRLFSHYFLKHSNSLE